MTIKRADSVKRGHTHITFVFENHSSENAAKIRELAKKGDYDAFIMEFDKNTLII